MRILGILGILFALAIGAGVAYLFLEDQKQQQSEYSANVERIRELQRLDAAWSVATLRTMTVFQSDFDALAGFLPRVRVLKRELQSGDLASNRVSPSLNNLLLRYIALLDAKQEAVERFKSNHAIIRNSIKYLPLAAATLERKAAETENTELAEQVRAINDGITKFMQNPDEGAKLRLLSQLDPLNIKLMEYPQDIVNPLSNFLSHAKVMLQRKIPMDKILQRVIDEKANAAGSQLIDIYTAFHQQQQLLADQKRLALFLAAAVASVLLFIYALLLVFAGGRRGKQLEAAVAARTRELKAENESLMESQVGDASGVSANSMNSMAAMIAHEINTPLGYISSNIEALQSSSSKLNDLKTEFDGLTTEASNDPENTLTRLEDFGSTVDQTWHHAMVADMPDMLQDMQDGVGQIERTITSLRDFTRNDRSNEDWFQLNDCIDDVLKMTASQIPENIEIKTDLGKLPPIYGSASEMNQVFMNLIINGVHAVEGAERKKGVIRISTRKERKGVSAQVLDNGSGMDHATEEKIFDPFFTTKEVGKGTGLGLSIVKRIIESHHGTLALKTVRGKGTNFKISLPRK